MPDVSTPRYIRFFLSLSAIVPNTKLVSLLRESLGPSHGAKDGRRALVGVDNHSAISPIIWLGTSEMNFSLPPWPLRFDLLNDSNFESATSTVSSSDCMSNQNTSSKRGPRSKNGKTTVASQGYEMLSPKEATGY